MAMPTTCSAAELFYPEECHVMAQKAEQIRNLAGKENKRRLQTLSIDNAWCNKNFLVYLTFRMLQHTSSEVNGYNCYKHLKIQK